MKLSFVLRVLLIVLVLFQVFALDALAFAHGSGNQRVRTREQSLRSGLNRSRQSLRRTRTPVMGTHTKRFLRSGSYARRAQDLYRWGTNVEDVSRQIQLPIERTGNRFELFRRLYRNSNRRPRYTRARSAAQTREQLVQDLVERGITQANAEQAALQAQLGLPSDANTSTNSDFLLARRDMVISYNEEMRGPNWIAWTTTPQLATKGRNVKRQDVFREDPMLPQGMAAATLEDYLDAHGPVDIGHVVRAAERSATNRSNQRTFVMTNTLPQANNNDTGPWLKLEDHLLEQVRRDGKTVLTIAGAIWGNNPVRIGRNRVAMPQATWKVAIVLEPGQTAADITANTPVIATIVPNSNQDVERSDSWQQYRVTVRDIERATGLQLLTALPHNVAESLRDQAFPEAAVTATP